MVRYAQTRRPDRRQDRPFGLRPQLALLRRMGDERGQLQLADGREGGHWQRWQTAAPGLPHRQRRVQPEELQLAAGLMEALLERSVRRRWYWGGNQLLFLF